MSHMELWIQVRPDTCDTVEVSEENNVLSIIDKIRTQFKDYSDIERVDLVLYRKRKRENGEDVEALARSMTVKAMLQEQNFAGSSEFNPIFIKKYEQRIVWKPVEIRKTSLIGGNLHLTQMKDTLEMLQIIHLKNFSRRKEEDGYAWIIPVMDNLYGMGKSSFAKNYISMCQDYNLSYLDSDFLEEITQARTIYVRLSNTKFNFENYQESMLQIIKKTVFKNFVYGMELFKNCMNSESFLELAVHYGGPIFLVLDEIGEIFKSAKNLEEGTTMFWILVKDIFKGWCSIEKFYFLLVGCSPYVVSFPEKEIPIVGASPFCIERLTLTHLNLDSIAEIIRLTNLSKKVEKTLYQHYNLDEEKLKNISKRLLFWTNGVPREMSTILAKCKTYERLVEYNQKPIQSWKAFRNFVLFYQPEVEYLLNQCIGKSPVDLTKEISKTKVNGKSLYQNIIMHQIATDAGFTWTGDNRNAILKISDSCKNYILNMDNTLMAYLDCVSKSQIHIDKIKSWEWVCTRKMIELFIVECKVGNVSPDFLDSPVFGSITNLKFSDEMIPFPKIADNGTKSVETNNSTVNTEYAPQLLHNHLEFLPVTLVPLSKSKSPDAILAANVCYENTTRKLVVGLSMKKYTGRHFGKTELEHEYQLFVDCFKGYEDKNLLKILIIFCTNFSKEFEEQLKNKFFFCYEKENSELDEIIVLNLMNKEMRALFFGLHDAKLAQAIEKILEK